jgi:hypothetical protein
MAWASFRSKLKNLRRSPSLAPCDTIQCQNVGKLLTVAATVIGGSERDTACDIMTAHYIRVTVTVTMEQ